MAMFVGVAPAVYADSGTLTCTGCFGDDDGLQYDYETLPLEGRLPSTPGGSDYEAYYDPNLNITWAADASINGFGGLESQAALISELTIGGINNWRLPTADINGDGIVESCFASVDGCLDNELAFLSVLEGINSDNPGPFANVLARFYWSSTVREDSDYPASPWFFGAPSGALVVTFGPEFEFGGWAVHNGDVAVVPIPAAIWLFGSAIAALIVGYRAINFSGTTNL